MSTASPQTKAYKEGILQALEGSIISRYRLQKQIDAEEASKSYLATDRRTGRTVIMKLVPYSNDEDIAHLQGEIQKQSESQHEHTSPVLDHGKHDAWYYIVTPYNVNKVLKQQLPKDALSTQDADDILEQPAEEPEASLAQKFIQQKVLFVQNLTQRLVQKYKDKRLLIVAIAAAAIITLVSLFAIGVSSFSPHDQAVQQNRQASWASGTISPSATISPTAQNKSSKKPHAKRARAINEQTYGVQPTVQPVMQPYSTPQPTVPPQSTGQPTVQVYPTSQSYPPVQVTVPSIPTIQPTVQAPTPTPTPSATTQPGNHGKGKGKGTESAQSEDS
jgi:hypothetical protein